MESQVTPQQFIAFLFVLCFSGVLVALYWYWQFGTGPLAWGLAALRVVKSFLPVAPIMSRAVAQTVADEQTDRQTDVVSEADLLLDRLEIDRTKTAVIELLVYSGWDVGQVRSVIKGDNGAIGTEVEAARVRLGIHVEPRQLRVRDAEGERMIPMET